MPSWLKEYVRLLNPRTKWSTPEDKDFKSGDPIWIIEPTNSRSYYPLARVVKLNFGSAAVALFAEVKNNGSHVRTVVKVAPVLFVSNLQLS